MDFVDLIKKEIGASPMGSSGGLNVIYRWGKPGWQKYTDQAVPIYTNEFGESIIDKNRFFIEEDFDIPLYPEYNLPDNVIRSWLWRRSFCFLYKLYKNGTIPDSNHFLFSSKLYNIYRREFYIFYKMPSVVKKEHEAKKDTELVRIIKSMQLI